MRIEAQGKYLQSILEKAKETLAGHTGTSPDLEAAHAEITELASKVTTESLDVPFSSLATPLMSADPRVGTLRRQQSRVSESSSQKSYLTNLTANPEDSGGASGSCEHQASNGKTGGRLVVVSK